MDLLVVSINAVVVAVVGGIVAWLGKGRFEALEDRIDRLEKRLDGRIDGLEGRFERLETRWDGRFETLQSSMDAMRSDITQVALAIGIRPQAQNG